MIARTRFLSTTRMIAEAGVVCRVAVALRRTTG